jgi:transketolase
VTTARGVGTTDSPEIAQLSEMARRIRVEIIRTVNHAQVGHIGGPLSAADILAALYFRVLRIRPDEPDWPDRDRFILSKGHTSLVQYAAMALRGYLPVDELRTFDSLGSRLQGHPDMRLLPGIDMSTGSLGMGLSAGLGMALGARFAQRDIRTYVLLGDGECQEGQVWEAAFVAARYRVDNLIAIVDHNKLQQYGWPGATSEVRLPPEEPGELVAKWSAFGWRVLETDGHDMAAVVASLEAAVDRTARPTVVVAHTVKGRGVSFMEGDYRWHSKPITPAEFAAAMVELGEAEA